ncbi:MoaD/ThiS family protein [Nitrospira sp. Kam-Ns4a]
MKVRLSHPDRDVEVKGPKRAGELLRELNLIPEAHLVIRGDDLVTEDEWLRDDDRVEVRPVISGGCATGTGFAARGRGERARLEKR